MAETWDDYLEAGVPSDGGGAEAAGTTGGNHVDRAHALGAAVAAAAASSLPVPQAPPAQAVDMSRDVLYARGAAAQTITNPGNILYYRMVDDRYEEWSELKSNDRQRGVICRDIVESFLSTGGVFRTKTGEVMDQTVAATKTKDRMRQIAKPKLRPTGFGEEDVVFTAGAANFLYPGNAKFKKLCEGYVSAYWKDFVDGSRRHTRPPHQVKIIDDLMANVADRGGKFRDPELKELSRKQIVDKIASRFRDLKKAQKKKTAETDAVGQRTGFTRVKSVVTKRKRKAKADDGGEKGQDGAGTDLGPDGAHRAFLAQYSWNTALADAADIHGRGGGGHEIVGRYMNAMREELEEACGADLCDELRSGRSKKRRSTKKKTAKRKPAEPKVEAIKTQAV